MAGHFPPLMHNCHGEFYRSFRKDKEGDLEIVLLFNPQVFLQGYILPLHSGSSKSVNHLRLEN